MLGKRLLLAGAVVTALIVSSSPASAQGRTIFVVSGGDLKRPVSFDSTRMGPVSSWRPESRVPYLTGWRYRLRMSDPALPGVFEEWTYVPDASGALPAGPIATRSADGRPIAWMAFPTSFNAELIGRIRASQESQAVFTLLTWGVALLLILTSLGLRLYAVPRWFMHWMARDMRIVSDPGPSFLYTSVPRSLWTEAGHLACMPTSLARSH